MTASIDRRTFLAALPALVAAPRLLAQGALAPQIRVNGLSQLTLSVSDPQRSVDFYQGLFGMPVQARQGNTTFLRIGDGPRFLAITPAAPGERPSISRFGLGVEGFNVDRVLAQLAQHGITRDDALTMSTPGPALKVRVTNRGNTPEMFLTDPSGIVIQLHDTSYCGGSGPLGNQCQVQAAPKKGLFALKDMSHFTVNASDPRTPAFFQETFGVNIQAYQATAPVYGVGAGVHFLMFITGGAPRGGGAGAGRGGAPGAGPAAPGAAPAPAGGESPAGVGRPGGAAPAPGAAAGGRGGAAAGSRIDHACMSMDNFVPDAVIKTLAEYGIKPSENTGRTGGPLTSWISVRTEARGGAPVTGTPELYFADPDGLSIQLQDPKYCGGGGFLGDVCRD